MKLLIILVILCCIHLNSATKGPVIACKCNYDKGEERLESVMRADQQGSLSCQQLSNGPKATCDISELGSRYCQQKDNERKEDFKACCGRIDRFPVCYEEDFKYRTWDIKYVR